MTGTVEAKEEQKVIALDAPNAFIQTCLENVAERIVLIPWGLAVDSLMEV